ncbi:MAG: hypothetical protein ACR2M9_02345 [Cyanophyceae cyanobacterium]
MKELENLIENTFKSKPHKKKKERFDLIKLVESIMAEIEKDLKK